ncbi:MAG: hypothetical protein IJR86_01800, partial [Bacteroidaceae bacterium]|nr:hypothetical protein [Bacteroidaceae bacterium]
SFTQTQGVTTKEQDVITVAGSGYNTVEVADWLEMDGTTYYSNKNLATVAEPQYKTGLTYYNYDPATKSYVAAASTPTVIDGKSYYQVIITGTGTTYDGSNITTGTWYTAEGLKVTSSWTNGTKYYAENEIEFKEAKPGYAAGTYYSRKNAKGYFMLIPAQSAETKWVDDLDVTVAIKYEVATIDPNLKDGISLVENNLKQTVTLKDFTNGKAYNLKLILGLTSVKVDAEVSNWEVGTVESNLPQNLE